MHLIWPPAQREYFRARGWTGFGVICPSGYYVAGGAGDCACVGGEVVRGIFASNKLEASVAASGLLDFAVRAVAYVSRDPRPSLPCPAFAHAVVQRLLESRSFL